jgi:hypothetical protein
MRRHVLRLATMLLIAAGTFTAVSGTAGAQTTTTTAPPVTTAPPATTTPTTPPLTTAPVVTTAGGTTVTTAAPIATTVPTTTVQKDDSGSSIPWVPIAIAIAVLAVIVVIVALLARRRGATRQLAADWRPRAADATAEAGAVARLLSQGTAPTGQIAQQLLASLRTFEDLEASAPSDSTAATAERARRGLQTLGLAIDADYRLRRSQPAPDPQQLARSQESVQNAAGETDRTLRGVYRSFTSAD